MKFIEIEHRIEIVENLERRKPENLLNIYILTWGRQINLLEMGDVITVFAQ